MSLTRACIALCENRNLVDISRALGWKCTPVVITKLLGESADALTAVVEPRAAEEAAVATATEKKTNE